MGAFPNISTTHPGDLIKEVLKERHISQKDFALLVGLRASHLNDILNRRRKITDDFALQVEKWLGIPARTLLELQATFNLVTIQHPQPNPSNHDEELAIQTLKHLDEFISVKTLLKTLTSKFAGPRERLEAILRKFNLTPEFEKEFNLLAEGNFRKSAKNGLDERMIATWILLAKAAVAGITPQVSFDYSSKKRVCESVNRLLHLNHGNLLVDLTQLLEAYGIVFRVVEKVDKASIDGFSFFNDCSVPCIVVTCRYDRIDNLAFTVMHELAHIYLKHTTPTNARINIDTRSINEDGDNSNIQIEKAADLFASEALIPPSSWNSIPPVPLNPFMIQALYTEWAERLHLNKWIVLGHISHITGMYKFKSDDSRKISGGKEVCVRIE